MKKSNQLALGLFGVVLLFYISNLIYHKTSFEKNIHSFPPQYVFDSQQNKVKLICIIDPQKQAANKISIVKQDKSERSFVSLAFEDNEQRDELFNSMTFNADTLYIHANTVPIRHPNLAKSEMKLTFLNVEKAFYNDSLISEF
ncbi:MAG: hypothetical protein KA206_03155 [Paludibacter sp.]|nr:hypothetical protein [Paludibacter sp.]